MIIYDDKLTTEDLVKLNICIEPSVKIGKNVKIGYGCSLLENSVVEDNCEIGNNSLISNSLLSKGVKVLSSYIEDSSVGENTTVGPFATIKKGAEIGGGCRIGNFVEIKNSTIGDKTKVAHLTYIGDAELGYDCNVGCGVVFCNYNGLIKQRSVVGDRVFIGSNVNLVAPVKIGDCAYIAAGSTVNKNVEAKQFVIARSRQTHKNNFDNPYLKKNK